MKREEEVILMATLVQHSNNPLEALIDFQTIEDMLTIQRNQILLNATKRAKDKSVKSLIESRLQKAVEQYEEYELSISTE